MLPGTDQIREFFGPFVCSAGGLLASILGFISRQKLADSKTWPKTTGEIIRSSIKYDYNSNRNIVRPDVAYEYTVEGVKYVSTQLSLVEVNASFAEPAERKAEKYSSGQIVDVYYNPKKPSEAVLNLQDPTHGALPWLIVVVGVILVVAGGTWTWRVASHWRYVPRGGNRPIISHAPRA